MRGINEILRKVNIRDLRLYLFFSLVLIVTLLSIRSLDFTQARYESEAEIDAAPTLAFFVVDVGTQSGQIKLTSMIPSGSAYTYQFNVSNFKDNRRANVDLTYSIELITTTNMHLDFKIFKGNDLVNDIIDSDTVSTDANGVYYRHLVINGVSVMNYTSNVTDVYTLWVKFPTQYNDNPDAYAGVIDLVDIKINAEQVV